MTLAPSPSYEELAITLARIAAIVHDGGLASVSPERALNLIRRLSLAHWDGAGYRSDRRRRVEYAIDASLDAVVDPVQFQKTKPPKGS